MNTVFFGTKDAIGHALGKEIRASAAVTDTGLAASIIKLLEESEDRTEVIEWPK